MSTLKNLGRYSLEVYLGAGAYAEVYRATDTALKRTVALKILKPMLLADSEAFARFVQEAQAAAGLFHPHIATVLDLGEADGRYFIAMRYVDGPSLDKKLVERGSLPWDEALPLAEQIAEALQYAHNRNLVHRDIKPQNILVSENEGAVLTDFGLVKAMTSSGMTRTGSFLGTPSYMAPEIWKGEDVTPATDQYALACVLVEMLTGKVLYGGKTPPAIMAKHFQPPALPERWPAGAPESLGAALSKALAQEPGDRFDTLPAFISAFQTSPPPVVSHAPPITSPASPIAHRKEDELRLTLAPGVTMEFVRVPAGEFLMGSDKAIDKKASQNECPQHKVFLDEYLIGKHPVTNLQYQVFVQSTGHQAPPHWERGQIPRDKEQHPVVYVSWQDAAIFCEWLSQAAGRAARLPTEAEWEKAARGSDGRIFPWGNDLPDKTRCNFGLNVNDTTPVGRYSPMGDSPYSCADMAGNVWEWAADWYDGEYYASSPSRNPSGPASGGFRALRGGSWFDFGLNLRVANRGRLDPSYRYGSIGFRCALSP
jgi:serine/threonine-protein kinase